MPPSITTTTPALLSVAISTIRTREVQQPFPILSPLTPIPALSPPPARPQALKRLVLPLACAPVQATTTTDDCPAIDCSALPLHATPVLALVNRRSGGQQGEAMLLGFFELLSPLQVAHLCAALFVAASIMLAGDLCSLPLSVFLSVCLSVSLFLCRLSLSLCPTRLRARENFFMSSD